MPSADLSALTAAVTNGFATLTAAVNASGSAVDLAPLTEQITRVANALYSEPEEDEKSVGLLMSEANDLAASVVGTYTDGERVKVYSEPPTP